MRIRNAFARMRFGLTPKRAAVAVAAVAMLGTGVGIAAAAGPPMPSGPFFESGTNGFPAGNKGAAKQVDEGSGGQGALLTSISATANQAGFGLVGVHFPGTFSQLSDVETQFNVTQSTCEGGAPRWAIDLQDPNNPKNTQFLLVYFDNSHQPFGGCNAGAQQETNIINNATTGWFVGNANAVSTYADVNAQYGTWKVQDVEVIVDAGWDQTGQLNPNIQQVLLQNMKINSKTYFPLPS